MNSEHCAHIKCGAASFLAAGLFLVPVSLCGDEMCSAFADDGTAGTIQIKKSDSNASAVTYKTYKLFNATVSKGKNAVTDIEYASTQAKTAIINAVNAYNAAHPSTKLSFDSSKTAQEAADLISKNISSGDSSASNSFADCLATAVKASCTAVTGKDVVSGGAAVSLPDGYYLFTGNDTSSTGKTNTASSSPIFAAVGGDTVTVSEKTAIPTVTKEIMEDSTNQYGPVADSTRGQNVSYRLVGTVASNIASYDTYKYVFHDSLSNGLTANKDVKVTIDNKVVSADSYTVTYDNTGSTATGEYASSSGITVTFNDLKSAKESGTGTKIPISSNTTVIVEYTASLNANSIVAGKGNPNQVYLEYSNNPQGSGTGKTTPAEVRDYAYRMKFNKVDNSTKKSLANAKFTIKSSSGKYIAKNSSGMVIEQDASYEWITDSNGLINIQGIDADTYTITETAAPASYKITAPFTVTINATYNSSTLTKINASIGGADHSMITAGIGSGSLVTNDNEIDVTVADMKMMQLPITGQAGIVLIVLAGGALIVASGVGFVRYNKKNRRNEQDENE